MRETYPYIFKRLVGLLAICALLWTAVLPSGATDDVVAAPAAPYQNSLENQARRSGEPGAPGSDDASDDAVGRGVKVGLGRVFFEIGPTGRWLALVPDWMEGNSVITGGGFVVIAVDESGAVVELANTARETADGLHAAERSADLPPVYEGIAGGARYPLAQRDDDGDGSEDEDRLDGVDNDGDGRVDEDYAAIGDQMIALGYGASGDDDKTLLQIHQECYTWTLPHIDGMVAMKLSVRNVSDRTLDNVYIGTVIRRRSGFSVSTQDLAPSDGGERLVSKGILLSGGSEAGTGEAVAALFFAEPATDDVSWLTGVASDNRRMVDLVQTYLALEIDAEGEPSPDEESGGDGDTPRESTGIESSDQTAYGFSPNLGTLAPGDEIVVYTAVLVVPGIDKIDRAIEDAYRTVVGDGTHRMVPPPVSVTRRSMWGTYKTKPATDDGAPAGVTIVLENARGQGIGADDVLYLNGIDLSRADVSEAANGDLRLALTGGLYEEIAETRGRVELHGRLRNGEFIDIVLNPAEADQQSEKVDGISEAQYWSRPGKLDMALLTGSPNPFRDATTIFYEVPASVSDEDGTALNFFNPIHTSVKIYNVAGRLVSILVDTIHTPGRYNTQWNAVDESGSGVASGVYYIKLQIGKKHVTKRLIQLK